MSRRRIVLIIAVALTVSAFGLVGCSKSTGSQSASTTAGSKVATPQASVEPTAPAVIVATGPITHPVTGSALRKELLDAARTNLKSTSEFYVYQLYVQGDTALGDLDPVAKNSNGRVFVAWERRNGKWVAIGASKYGSPAANAPSTARALPSFSPELIAKIDWLFKKPETKTAKATGVSEAVVKASLAQSAKEWSKTAMSGTGEPYGISLIKVVQDSKGVWWGRVVTQPTGGYERLQFWAKYENGAWSGSVQDPEPPAPSTFFPASVTAKLGF